MKRFVTTLPFVALVLLTFAGCDSNDPEPRTDAYSFSFAFYFEDTVRPEDSFVASQAFTGVDIPPSAVQDGAVLVYYWEPGSRGRPGTWTALPLTLGLEKPEELVVDYTVTFGYAFNTDFLELFFDASSTDPVVWDEIADIFGGGIDVKVVVIDSYVAADQEVDLTDYQAVKQHFHLAD